MGASAITPRRVPINQTAAAPFDARQMARDLLRSCRSIALATLDQHSGYPYSTVTNLSVEPDGSPLFYAAGISLHARNILADPRISMTLAQAEGLDVVSERRMTLVGRALPLEGEAAHIAGERYRRRFPKASAYIPLKDTMFFRVAVEAIHFNGGAARNTDQLTVADLHCDLAGADDLMRHEAEEIARLQADRESFAFLTAKAGGARGRWRIATIDPEGIDLAAERALYRIWFPQRVTSRAELRAMLAGLCAQARGALPAVAAMPQLRGKL
ncbi:HugZ family protein [Paracoccus sp. IB05]|uniref:HugZ family pyridoxamine 5'-phosphate oxidase n=1 Tax=Paracoccus sp. IB05 TaxID=2779367 RepID=UPI0018E71018|nr:pyridoxamine 5'-phosphate oxidase family protein [Paracoccus sp. IB05]MBJ2151177.1 HugZ family protein [Paracoccus sp. IB05]